MTFSDLLTEVSQFIEGKIAGGEVVANPWLVEAIMGNHPLPDEEHWTEGDDVEWWRVAAHQAVQDAVRQVTRRYKVTPDGADSQLTLPGYDRLQRAYQIVRDGSPYTVPIEKCTDDEMRAKQAELRAMATGCYQHVDEIERYLSERKKVA